MISGLNRTTLQTILCLITFFWFVAACQEQNRLQQVVAEPIEAVTIERIDQAWFELDPATRQQKNTQWIEAYGDVYVHYIEDVLRLGGVEDSLLDAQIERFVSDPSIQEVYNDVQSNYPNLDGLSEELTTAWGYYHRYFPNESIPKHIAVIGGFNAPAILTEHGVGVALDMYLGQECKFYDYLQLPVYLRNRMTHEHIAPFILKSWIETEFFDENLDATLLQQIVDQGKVLYCMDAIFPFMEDSLKIAYTSQQMAWARAHEEFVWAHFVDNELLFSSDPSQVAKFTNDGPFTVDLAKESPSRMGYFIGWQIVRAYMERQENIDLNALLDQKDAQYILNNSKYKP